MDRELIERIVQHIADADRDTAVQVMEVWADEHGSGSLVEQVLIPVLNRFNDIYAIGEQSPLARGYVAAKVAEDVMEMVCRKAQRDVAVEALRGPVVIGNIEDDFHALGRRIVGTFLKTDGWDVHDLGNDVPAEEFVDKAVEIGAKVIGVSAMMYTTAENIIKVREVLDARGLSGKIQLAVGGAVFILRPELVLEIGGDGTTRTAMGASSLFAQLWDNAVAAEEHQS